VKNIILEEGERLDRVNEKITLIQKKDGLTFGTDAFLLASFIKPLQKGTAVELGAGTGIISLLLAAREKFKHITAFEIQKDFAVLASRNIDFNELGEKVKVIHKDVLLASASDIGGVFGMLLDLHQLCKDLTARRFKKTLKLGKACFKGRRIFPLSEYRDQHRRGESALLFQHVFKNRLFHTLPRLLK
jgi:hypothetical protein